MGDGGWGLGVGGLGFGRGGWGARTCTPPPSRTCFVFFSDEILGHKVEILGLWVQDLGLGFRV